MGFKRTTPTLTLPPQGGGNKYATTPNSKFYSENLFPSPLEGESTGGGVRAGRREKRPSCINSDERPLISEQSMP